MKATRMNEIRNSMTAFSNTKLTRDELLSEMLKLQEEMAVIAFGTEEAEGKRLYDVTRHYSEINEERNHIADELVNKVTEECKVVTDLIKADFSGRKGEARAFSKFEYILSQNRIRKNIELTNGTHRTEIDALVVTEKAAFIIEVKNTRRDIFIDEDGEYYRTGEYLKWDCSLGSKLSFREQFVKAAAEKAGCPDLKIVKVVVFTDNRIKVQNRCKSIRTCFVNQLTSIIDTFKGKKVLSAQKMDELINAVDEMECKDSYEVKFDVEALKGDFADMVATLECLKDEKTPVVTVVDWKKTRSIFGRIFSSRRIGLLITLLGASICLFGLI